MKRAAVSLIVLVIAGILISCGDIGNPVQVIEPVRPPSQPLFVPGRVVVGFVDSVDFRFIQSFIAGMHLVPITISADSAFSMWIEVDSGNVGEQLTRLVQDSAVTWAEQRGYSGGDSQKTYLLATFRGTVPVSYALALIASIPGLSWRETLVSPRNAVVEVEVGREQHWIDVMKTYPFVVYSDFLHVVTISDQEGS